VHHFKKPLPFAYVGNLKYSRYRRWDNNNSFPPRRWRCPDFRPSTQ